MDRWRPIFGGRTCGCELVVTEPPEKLVRWVAQCPEHSALPPDAHGFGYLLRMVLDRSVDDAVEAEGLTPWEADGLRAQHYHYHGL